MLATILQSALLVAGLGAFFEVARRSARRPAVRDPETGELILQFNKFLVWTMGGIAVLGPVGLAILSFVIPFKNEREVYIPIAMGLFFLLLGGFLFIYLSRRRTRVSEAGLTSEYLFARPYHIPWESVTRLKFSGNQELHLYDTRGKKATLHIWLAGIQEVVPLLRARLPQEVQRTHQTPLEGFIRVAGGSPARGPSQR